MVTGISDSADVIIFHKDYLGVIVNEWDLQACHPRSKLYSELKPPAVIVGVLHFNIKDRIWGRKHMLRGKTNTKKFAIFLRERLMKADSDFLDYARGLGRQRTSYNSVPQILMKDENGVRTHNIADTCDVKKFLHLEKQ